ncbi:MAG: N-acetylmuramoyl-L-alanine amidase [Candidatus Cloacimonetes bacterium]|nr:N-acetylmuramoyl-L-alanine amidase [Candidatus Cloacimonadota bacterium]
MIILNPMGSSNGAYLLVNNVYDYNVTYSFASSIAAYLRLRGENCILTRYTSESLVGIAYNSFIVNNAPDIIINIKCITDLTAAPQGYTVECDKYSALTATISAEISKMGITPVYPLGYKVVSAKTSAKYTEITIGLGYLTNPDDFAKISDNTFLDLLAKHIVDASYGPPTKIMQPSDSVYVKDSYMYDTSAWIEDAVNKLTSDVGVIVEDSITNVPVRILRLKTTADVRVGPYTYHTPINIVGSESLEASYTIIVSYRIKAAGGSGIVKAGSTVKALAYEDSAWHKIVFEYAHTDGDVLTLGANANTSIDFTAVWVTNSGVLDSVDDPLKNYSMFPPGYRPITSIDPTSIKDSIANVVTNASSLIGRAQDTSITNANSKIKESLGMLDQISISVKPFVDGIKGVMSQVTGLLKLPSTKIPAIPGIKIPPVPNPADYLSIPTIPKVQVPGIPKLPSIPSLPPFPSIPMPKLPGMPNVAGLIKNNQLAILDPKAIVPQFAALENTVVSMTRADKRGDMLHAVNTLKGASQAAAQLTTTYEDKLEAAKNKALEVKLRTEVKGEAMSKT